MKSIPFSRGRPKSAVNCRSSLIELLAAGMLWRDPTKIYDQQGRSPVCKEMRSRARFVLVITSFVIDVHAVSTRYRRILAHVIRTRDQGV